MKGFRTLIHPVIIQLSKIRIHYNLLTEGDLPNRMDCPCIYAVNHTNSADLPMALRAVGKNCTVLLGKQPLYFSDRLFFWLNGAIWVDRKNKQNMLLTKEKLISHLNKKKSVIWFPEGTWNQTDNLLMLPMKWGIIDVAQKARAKIIPIALEYNKENNWCMASIGEVIDPSKYTLSDGINHLRDSMANMSIFYDW